MNALIKNVHADLLLAMDTFGSEFIYEEHEGQLIAIEFDYEGDEISRYIVKVTLEKQ